MDDHTISGPDSADLFFEDFEPGTVFELGSRTISKEEIIAFARDFDPQPFHVDEEAAAKSAFGGLIASGMHTSAIFMRLYFDAILSRAAGMGSPGVEELRWPKAVRPGDTLHARLFVLNSYPSTHRVERGTVQLRAEMSNQHGETVMTMMARGLFARRNQTAAISSQEDVT